MQHVILSRGGVRMRQGGVFALLIGQSHAHTDHHYHHQTNTGLGRARLMAARSSVVNVFIGHNKSM